MFSEVTKKTLKIEICMIFLMFICLLPMIFKPCIWYDESFTINIVRESVSELLRITALDVHPPLYYLVVKLFVTLLGDELWVYHIPSLLSYILILVLTSLFFLKAFNERVSLVVTAAFCSMPNMIKYALEIRMYSMSMFFILSGMYVSYFIIKECDDYKQLNWKSLRLWVLLALINVASAYTHYFAGVAAVGISIFLLLYLLLRHRLKKGIRVKLFHWSIYCIIMFVLYLPWLPTLLSQMSAVNKDYWIGPLTEASLHYYPETIFDASTDFVRMALKVFFLLGLFMFVAYFSKNMQYFWLAGCFFVVGFWLLFGISYSMLRSPILVQRYQVMLLPLIWLPVVSAYAFADKEHISYVVFILFAVCYIQNYEKEYEVYSTSGDIELVEFGKQQIKENDVFLHIYMQPLSICNVYFPENEHYVFSYVLGSEPALSELVDCHQIEEFDELASVSGNIWCTTEVDTNTFAEAGFQVEAIQLGTGQIFRIYKDNE